MKSEIVFLGDGSMERQRLENMRKNALESIKKSKPSDLKATLAAQIRLMNLILGLPRDEGL